jgi:hypothetical protein
MEGSKDEVLMDLVARLVMTLIGFLDRGLYEEDERRLRSFDSH